eukprot:IDg19301t1
MHPPLSCVVTRYTAALHGDRLRGVSGGARNIRGASQRSEEESGSKPLGKSTATLAVLNGWEICGKNCTERQVNRRAADRQHCRRNTLYRTDSSISMYEDAGVQHGSVQNSIVYCERARQSEHPPPMSFHTDSFFNHTTVFPSLSCTARARHHVSRAP